MNLSKEQEMFYIQQVKINPLSLKDIDTQTDVICLEAVKRYGSALEYVKNQTEEICLEAVTCWPNSLKFVKDQTKEICLEAVKTYSGSLVGHRIETEELYLTALFNQRTTGEISFSKRTEEMEALFSILKNGPISSYRQNRYNLVRNSKKITDSPYHVLDCLYGY